MRLYTIFCVRGSNIYLMVAILESSAVAETFKIVQRREYLSLFMYVWKMDTENMLQHFGRIFYCCTTAPA